MRLMKRPNDSRDFHDDRHAEDHLGPRRAADGVVDLEDVPWWTDCPALGLPSPPWPFAERDPPAFDVTLALVIPLNRTRQRVPVLSRAAEWRLLALPVGGSNLNHLMITAVPLPATPAALQVGREIARRFWGTNFNLEGRLSFITAYQHMLGRLDVDCEYTWNRVREAFYPIDMRQEYADRLTGGRFHLESLFEARPDAGAHHLDNAFMKPGGVENPVLGAVLAFLADNSD
jgi:hypothetical protein